jgi:hypothetical protein
MTHLVSGVSMQRALEATTPAVQGSPGEPAPRYTLMRQLPGGLRSELWLALAEGRRSSEDVVLLKVFVPHAPGPALDALGAELDLARSLSHENLAPTVDVGFQMGRHFVAKRYLEGATLQAVLRWAELAKVRLASAVVVRVLSALIAVVDHAERLSENVAARMLSRQPIGVDDVFITEDGGVRVLGLKMPFGQRSEQGWSTATSVPPAIDELLSGHLTPELGEVLAQASRSSAKVRAFERLRHVGEVLRRWQYRVIGSDGQAELAGVMAQMPATLRIERRARLDAVLEAGTEGCLVWPERCNEEPAPRSGFRRVGQLGSLGSSSVRLVQAPAYDG